ncbi:MAG: ABC transporter ATP-binding protein [Bacteroidales bacterium]|nr:ABC transporter ATP-binding protein [Bacteroidales bacterium]
MIRVESLTFSVDKFRIDKANIHIAKGEYFVLLGQPGSGKTIFLECLCGLNTPEAGKIYINGKDVTNTEPRKRSIGYVPQDYALFPYLSVEKNISFGLRGQRLPSGEIKSRVEKNASMLGISHLLKRKIEGLSGGEKQRTALARALTIKPDVLLLDEPVSALDESTRDIVCMELRELQKELGITTMHVSHNLEEAFSVADRGAILRNGIFEQVGSPDDLLRKPKNKFVAKFMRCCNVFSGYAKGPGPEHNTTCVDVNGIEFIVPGIHHESMEFIVRPENISLQRDINLKTENPVTQIPVQLDRIINRGTYLRLDCSGKVPVVVYMQHNFFSKLGFSIGDKLSAAIQTQLIHCLNK